jgi:cytochrome c oxidase subunit IV
VTHVDPREHVESSQAPAQHVTPRRVYYLIFGVLMLLTTVTVVVAFLDLGVLNTPIALIIAIIKATLVILYFMHVRYSTRLTWVVVIVSFLFVGILFVLTFSDYVTRGLSPY